VILVIAYRVNIRKELSLGGVTYPPGVRVYPEDFEKETWRQLLVDGIVEKKRTQVTDFCLDPELLRDQDVMKLRIMVQNRGRKAPQTKEECINILSHDFIKYPGE